ncbi:ferrochelatase [Phototrophicus methaneseepsis]|uniref:Ferrochelatase n=1 Tax=Phototrophicus methaneseepsis TaxID=2710758 RepID=A0A7S8IGC7_9CHLR|nr:ferrochelatase [Phototrophicus methaneseepsis]QPC84601.1 ferrochelatase [Phototrophicus methaneseepsis]
MHEAETKPIGVIVAQLGTPEAPTAKGLRTYLAEFLSDMRVIDYHPLVWQPILRGIILRVRPSKSARLYQRIWLKEGSPLLVYSQRQVEKLQAILGDHYRVILGMTYGRPNIKDAVATLEAEGIDRILVLPMFPQYSSTTTASIYDAVYDAAAGNRASFAHQRKRFVPTLRFVEPYYDDPRYIDAMKTHLQQTINSLSYVPDQYIITFHGIPDRYLRTGDPYRQQCEHTANLLADAMGWRADEWQICFQSRFGPEEWLQPYTDQVLEGLHHQGYERPLVFSPGFVTDCLETLDELGNEGQEQFEEGGGHPETYHLASCLNDHPAWIDTMVELVRQNALGWAPQEHEEADLLPSFSVHPN